MTDANVPLSDVERFAEVLEVDGYGLSEVQDFTGVKLLLYYLIDPKADEGVPS